LILRREGAVQVQTLGGDHQEPLMVRGLAEDLRQSMRAIVEVTDSVVSFSDANLGMRWLLAVPLTARGELRVCAFGQIATVAYTVEYEASGLKPAMVLGVVAGTLAFLIRSPATSGLVAILAALFGYGWVYRMLPSAAGWFEIRLRKMASTATQGSQGVAPA